MKRKTDRRTLMTKQMIKDALLELLAHTPYEKVTVSALCRQAEITRATFYLHYDNTESVLSELLDDALRLTELADRPQEPWTGELLEKPEAAATPADLDAMLPACQRAASNPKYRVLFLDESLSRHILQKLADFQRPRRVPQIMKRYHVSEWEAEQLFVYMLHGNFALNRSLGWVQSDEWYRAQALIQRLVAPEGLHETQNKMASRENDVNVLHDDGRLEGGRVLPGRCRGVPQPGRLRPCSVVPRPRRA